MEEKTYKFPSRSLLTKNELNKKKNVNLDKLTIKNFFLGYKVDIDCIEVYNGINSTTYVIDLKLKNKVSTIQNFKQDLMYKFNATDVIFQIAINGTNYLGIQLIFNNTNTLLLGDVIERDEFIKTTKKVPIILGEDFTGKLLVEDLAELPHLLIAGTTGTGKSNFLSTLVVDIIYKFEPSELKLVLADTRGTNFPRFNGIPHLLVPVITDANKIIGAISFLIQEMYNRYTLFERQEVDNIDAYNKKAEIKLPRIILIVEDYCDLMEETNKDIEEYVQRLTQMSRAAGIYVIISTQRPSTDVITGVIKANILARIAFKVPSKVDSKTIIDTIGAEKLFLHGDIIYSIAGRKNMRIQTPYISDEDIETIAHMIKYDNYDLNAIKEINTNNEKEPDIYDNNDDYVDPRLEEAIEEVIVSGQTSTSFIQRRLKVGYERAGKIIDQMTERGIISGYQGSKPREVLMTKEKWEELKNGKPYTKLYNQEDNIKKNNEIESDKNKIIESENSETEENNNKKINMSDKESKNAIIAATITIIIIIICVIYGA